jgi:hypothetical protein
MLAASFARMGFAPDQETSQEKVVANNATSSQQLKMSASPKRQHAQLESIRKNQNGAVDLQCVSSAIPPATLYSGHPTPKVATETGLTSAKAAALTVMVRILALREWEMLQSAQLAAQLASLVTILRMEQHGASRAVHYATPHLAVQVL